MYSKEKLAIEFEKEDNPIKKVYLMCHLFVDTLIPNQNPLALSKQEFYEYFIFTCRYIVFKFSRANTNDREQMLLTFVDLLSKELVQNHLFKFDFEAFLFISRRFDEIGKDIDNLSEPGKFIHCIYNIYHKPFNDDNYNINKIKDILSPEEISSLDMDLKRSIDLLIKGTNDVVKLWS